MDQDVNLLKVETKAKKRFGMFFLLSLVLLLVTVFIAAAVILYLLVLKTQLSSVNQQQAKELSTMKAYDAQRVKLLTLQERLLTISKISTSNTLLSKRIGELARIVPAGINVDDIAASQSKITLTISSSNLLSINQFISTNLATFTKEKKSEVKRVDIDSFDISKEGLYQSKISFLYSLSSQ